MMCHAEHSEASRIFKHCKVEILRLRLSMTIEGPPDGVLTPLR